MADETGQLSLKLGEFLIEMTERGFELIAAPRMRCTRTSRPPGSAADRRGTAGCDTTSTSGQTLWIGLVRRWDRAELLSMNIPSDSSVVQR